MRRRLSIAALLVLALAGGLWWTATRLNETERKLVGVWEEVSPNSPGALLLLPDRREFFVDNVGGKWTSPSRSVRWKASPLLLTFRLPPPSLSGRTLSAWLQDAFIWWKGGSRFSSAIVRLTDDEFEYRISGVETRTLRRSRDPELLSIFDRLSAGESP